MHLACSTRCFATLDLSEAFRKMREMGFSKVDLALLDGGPHPSPGDVAEDAASVAQYLRASNMTFCAFHLGLEEGVSVSDGVDLVRAVGRLARLLAAPVVTLKPTGTGDLHDEAKRLTAFALAAGTEGVTLCVETCAGTLTDDPDTAAELCRRVPDLGIAYDPGQLLRGDHADAAVEPMYPFVRHVRVRDTGSSPEQSQTRVGQGNVEFGRITSSLERAGYSRAITIDMHDDPNCGFPVAPEVRKLKYLVESMI